MSDLSRRTFLTAMTVGGVGAVAACSAQTGSSVVESSSAPPAPEAHPTGAWRIPDEIRAPKELIGIFTPTISVLPGAVVPLHVAGKASKWSLEIFRIGDYEGLGGTSVAKMGPFPTPKQQGQRDLNDTRAAVATWPHSMPLDTTGWAPGFYLMHAVANGLRTEAPLIIRQPSARNRVAVITSETTMQAYNRWGGRSLYKDSAMQFANRSFAVTTNRPLDASGRALLYAFEIPVVRVAEESGVPISYLTNVDISLDPTMLEGAKAAISTGHDEYWSVPYRDALVQLRNKGGNIAFLGANTGYWRVRVSDKDPELGRMITCYKDADADPVSNSRHTTARWRDSPHETPETTVVGQLYDSYPSLGDMKIRDPDFFLFKGTGVKEGTTFHGLLATETDRYYDIESTPRPLQVPTLGEIDCRGAKSWSTMTYYSTPSGAGVLSTGTMGWCAQLPRWRKDIKTPGANTKFAKAVTLNVFHEFAKGPVGRAHPATNDSASLNLPLTNTTGSA